MTTNTYDRPSLSANDPIKRERKAKRRSLTKEPSIIRQCENAIQRDEVTRLRVRVIVCSSSHPHLISDLFRFLQQRQVKDLQRRLREAEKVKREDIKPAIRTTPEVIDLTQ